VPILHVLKTDGKEAVELIQELKQGQKDPSVFHARIELLKCEGFDMDAVKEINELKFDMNNNFLLGVGETSFTVIDLRESQLEPDKNGLKFKMVKRYEVQPVYEEIKTIKFCTNGVLDHSIFKDFVSEKCTNTRKSID
jgi:hypothetical protein